MPCGASLRTRKARGIETARIQTLARSGAVSGLLTPREVKEVCQAVVAEVERRGAAGSSAIDAGS